MNYMHAISRIDCDRVPAPHNSVCLSVRPSHTVSKWLNMSSKFFHRMMVQLL